MNVDAIERNRTPARNLRFWIIGTLAAMALIFGGIVLKTRADRTRTEGEIQKRLDAIRAAGEPVLGSELKRLRPNPPPDRDFHAFIKRLNTDTVLQTEAWSKLRTQPLDDSVLAMLKAETASNAPVLDVILRTDLSGMESGVDWPANPDNVPYVKIGSIFSTIKLVQALGELAVYEATAGRCDQAALALLRSFEAAHSRGLFIIGAVGQVSCESLSIHALQMAVNRCVFSEPDLQRLDRVLVRRSTNLLHAAVVEERVMTIWVFTTARDNPNLLAGPNTSASSLGSISRFLAWCRNWILNFGTPVYRAGDFVAMLDKHALLEQASDQSFRERLRVFRDTENWRRSLDLKTTCLAVRFAMCKWETLANEDAIIQARLLAARTALAIERWRLAHEGRPPDSLAQLVPDFLPAVPMDPFDGQPLRYRKLDRGYVVYSVGPDFTDGGGLEKPADAKESTPYDIPFTVGR